MQTTRSGWYSFVKGEQGFGAGFILFIAVDVATRNKLDRLH
jgi:hypothetical protein